MDFYYRIPDYPEKLSSATIFVRLLDGLGFRFYWATEGLQLQDYSFRPANDTMSIEELVLHIWGLMNWVSNGALKKQYTKPTNGEKAREQTLKIIKDLREALLNMDDEELKSLRLLNHPFWNIINGPFSDALTHTGQINSFRRLAGNPVAGANVFKGEPPKSKIIKA